MIDVDYYLLLLIIDLSINDVWIYISGQTDLVHRLGKSVYAKVRNDIFCPGIRGYLLHRSLPFAKKQLQKLKTNIKNSVEGMDNEFRFGPIWPGRPDYLLNNAVSPRNFLLKRPGVVYHLHSNRIFWKIL